MKSAGRSFLVRLDGVKRTIIHVGGSASLAQRNGTSTFSSLVKHTTNKVRSSTRLDLRHFSF